MAKKKAVSNDLEQISLFNFESKLEEEQNKKIEQEELDETMSRIMFRLDTLSNDKTNPNSPIINEAYSDYVATSNPKELMLYKKDSDAIKKFSYEYNDKLYQGFISKQKNVVEISYIRHFITLKDGIDKPSSINDFVIVKSNNTLKPMGIRLVLDEENMINEIEIRTCHFFPEYDDVRKNEYNKHLDMDYIDFIDAISSYNKTLDDKDKIFLGKDIMSSLELKSMKIGNAVFDFNIIHNKKDAYVYGIQTNEKDIIIPTNFMIDKNLYTIRGSVPQAYDTTKRYVYSGKDAYIFTFDNDIKFLCKEYETNLVFREKNEITNFNELKEYLNTYESFLNSDNIDFKKTSYKLLEEISNHYKEALKLENNDIKELDTLLDSFKKKYDIEKEHTTLENFCEYSEEDFEY